MAITVPPPKDGAPRALVVDDSPIVRKIVAAGLRNAGLAITEAEDGATALALLRRESFDVVVTDLQMPGMGGLELLERMRKEGFGAEVVLLTGAGAEDIQCAIGALRLGAHDYIVKGPASSEAVVLSVQRALEKKSLRDENMRLSDELRRLALRDALTGLPNRRAFDAALAHEIDRADRFRQPFSLLVADLDRFKAVNDKWGHAAGDAALRHFAALAERVFRRADAVYRFGGEEFAAILPQTGQEGALEAALRLVEETGRGPVDVGAAVLRLTCSVGVASRLVGELGTADALVAVADAALYEAKRGGRNRAVLASTQAPRPPAPQAAVGVRG